MPPRGESWHYEFPMSHASIDWSGIFHIMATLFTDDGTLDIDGGHPGSAPGATTLDELSEVLAGVVPG